MSSNMNMDFYEFGKRMKIVAIMVILMIIPYVGSFLMIVGWIFAILALQNIQNANLKLNNTVLEEFRSKYYIALIFYIISSVTAIIGLFIPLNFLLFMYSMSYASLFASLLPAIIILALTYLFDFIGAIIEYGAWGKFELFLTQNGNIFPPYLAKEASDGARNLKNGALMYILFFLIITILIGWIFRIIGYFKLAKLEQIMAQPGVVSQQQPVMAPMPTSEPAPAPSGTGKNFCPNCGAEIKGAGKFCGECGSPLE